MKFVMTMALAVLLAPSFCVQAVALPPVPIILTCDTLLEMLQKAVDEGDIAAAVSIEQIMCDMECFGVDCDSAPEAKLVPVPDSRYVLTAAPAPAAAAMFASHPCTVSNETTCDFLIWRDGFPSFPWLPAGTNTSNTAPWAGWDSVDYIRIKCEWYKLEGQYFSWQDVPHYRIIEIPCGSGNISVEKVVTVVNPPNPPTTIYLPLAPEDCGVAWCPTAPSAYGCYLDYLQCPDCGGGGGGDPEDPPLGGSLSPTPDVIGDPEVQAIVAQISPE